MTGNTLYAPRIKKTLLIALFLCLSLGAVRNDAAAAGDLALADSSPIAGITFEQKPMVLPVQRNFQMAMLTASSALRRSCGKIEAYGWRMGVNDQERVDSIFNDTIDRLRAQGFTVESQSTNTVAKDVTLLTADRSDKNLIFMWSAGDIGLVAVLCETSRPLGQRLTADYDQASIDQSQTLRLPTGHKEKPPEAKAPMGLYAAAKAPNAPTSLRFTRAGRDVFENFSPVGEWEGTYTCTQGTTGATLRIDSMKGERFSGRFHFYPTAKNPHVPKGSYTISGDYDSESQRILINPDKWIERPENYFNTIIIGSFNPANQSFSAYFQGIMGCTSFEAKYKGVSSETSVIAPSAPEKKAVKSAPVKKKKSVKKAAKKKAPASVETKKLDVPADIKLP